MKYTIKLFQIGLRQMVKDGMLLMLLPLPFFAGVFFKYGIPFIGTVLEHEFSFSITTWYPLLDGFLICLTPLFVAMISAFLLLEEKDEGIFTFYQITPAHGHAYLFARLAIPMLYAFIITIAIVSIFKLSPLSFYTIFISSIMSCLTGIFLAMMLVSFANNKVEGLALSKLMGISMIGLISLWLFPAPYHYVVAFLPSFWIGKILVEGANIISFICGNLCCFLWIAYFYRKYKRKL